MKDTMVQLMSQKQFVRKYIINRSNVYFFSLFTGLRDNTQLFHVTDAETHPRQIIVILCRHGAIPRFVLVERTGVAKYAKKTAELRPLYRLRMRRHGHFKPIFLCSSHGLAIFSTFLETHHKYKLTFLLNNERLMAIIQIIITELCVICV